MKQRIRQSKLKNIPEKDEKSAPSRKWSGVLGWVVYLIVMVVVVFALPKALSAALGTPYPMAAITSGSMWPALRTGDLIFIKKVDPVDLQVGDVVVFRNKTNNTFTIHRIVRLDTETFTTKGDANFDNDPPTPYSDLVGRTVTAWDKLLRVPYAGSVTMLASNLRQSQQ